MADVFGRPDPAPDSDPVIPMPDRPAAVPPPGMARVRLSAFAEPGQSAAERAVIQIGDGPQLRLVQRLVVELDAATRTPVVTVTFVPGSVEIDMEADVALQYGAAAAPAGPVSVHETLNGQTVVRVVQGPPPAAGPGGTPLDPVEVSPEALRRLADDTSSILEAEWKERLAALEAEGRARHDEIRRAAEAAGEVAPAP